MNHIKNVVGDYIKTFQTDYAIMIDGQWGAGKSYYRKHTLRPMIEATEYAVGKTYGITKISLFGIQSVDDLKLQMYLPLCQDENKRKRWYNIGSSALSNVTKQIGVSFDSKTAASLMSMVFPNLNTRVYCFDDLERLNPAILKEVLGFINNLIEEKNLKVILICNGEECKSPDYISYKEKLVRFTCRLKCDIPSVLDTMMKDKEETDFGKFILKNKNWIGSVYENAECDNLRTLKFNMDVAEQIYPVVSENMGQEEWNVRESVLLLSMAYSIECRTNADKKITDNLLGITQSWFNQLSMIDSLSRAGNNTCTQRNDMSESEMYKRAIRDKYFKNSFIYGSSRSLLDYIRTGRLDITLLANEVTQMTSEAKRMHRTHEQQLMAILGNFWDTDDEVMKNAIQEVLLGTQEMRYPMAYYPNYFLRLQKLQDSGFGDTGYNIPELKDLFLKAIEGCKKTGYDEQLNGIYQNTDGATSEFRDLAEKVYDLNFAMRNSEHGGAFIDAIIHLDSQTDLRQFWNLPISIFEGVPVDAFMSSFFKCHNSRKRDVYNFMKERSDCKVHRNFDETFIKGLIDYLTDYLADTNVKPSPSRKYCEHLLRILVGESDFNKYTKRGCYE